VIPRFRRRRFVLAPLPLLDEKETLAGSISLPVSWLSLPFRGLMSARCTRLLLDPKARQWEVQLPRDFSQGRLRALFLAVESSLPDLWRAYRSATFLALMNLARISRATEGLLLAVLVSLSQSAHDGDQLICSLAPRTKEMDGGLCLGSVHFSCSPMFF
jgi:hypothetical protein